LLEAPDKPQFISDGGTGLAAGVKTAEIKARQLDWDHLWGQITRLERQAYTAWEAVEERATKFAQSRTSKRPEQHLTAWEHLTAAAEVKIDRYAAFHPIAQPVDVQFAMLDLESGELRDAVAAAECLCDLEKQLQSWRVTSTKS